MKIWSVTLYKQKFSLTKNWKYIFDGLNIYVMLSVNCEGCVWINAKLCPLDVRR
jgi:hypothetical protein